MTTSISVTRIEKALKDHDGDRARDVTELLADIRHYCDVHSLDYGKLDSHGYQQYLEDKAVNAGRP